jgi:hypothetical protein
MDTSDYSSEELEKLYKEITEFESTCEVEIKYKEIDWGQPKGQGKRIGCNMVVGNPDAPRGIKKYPYVNLSEYLTEETKAHFKHLNINQAYMYVVARKYGLEHREAMKFVILKVR